MTQGESTHDLAVALEPALREACRGSLGDIEWFITAAQRGGAATGASNWTPADSDQPQPVIVKLPVGPAEFAWNTALAGPDRAHASAETPPLPRVIASHTELGGYDLAWIVVERLGPALAPAELTKEDLRAALEVVARFHRDAAEVRPVGPRPQPRDWAGLVDRSRRVIRDRLVHIPDDQRWNEALRKLTKLLPTLTRTWDARPIETWCHGDVHCANIMRRGPDDHEDLALIDLGLVHAGSWIEDALYLERQFWAHPDALHGVKPLQTLARARKALGLDNGEDYAHLAHVRRLLVAGCVPALYADEGSPAYAKAALGWAEKLVKQLA
ncbi:MAG: aminoglycoside phosphotransferase family protein [Planctomycetota bacterium]